jgi:hypothetical protein
MEGGSQGTRYGNKVKGQEEKFGEKQRSGKENQSPVKK